ncbi:MAG TPA: HD domain-containing protein [Thermomicrobiaceae bacterium]|nr:HD domain-containing protein [Thermomicrobiaceae bacterium]
MQNGADAATRDPALERAFTAATITTPDPEHSLHVARLSLQLVDQLAEPLALPAEGRDLLAAAALWHDAGQRFTLPEHHLRSFDIISNERLHGFDDEDRLAIANIARYHRQSTPELEHTGYRNLRRERRPLVEQMAAILRLAEALDASHLQLVDRVVARVSPGLVEFDVVAASYPTIEVERAQARGGLFRQVFRRETSFRWRRDVAGSA